MNELIAKIGKYVLKKNALITERQKARSKVRYYEKLFKLHGKTAPTNLNWIRGWRKWNKPGKKQQLRLLTKKHLAQQLQAEIELHELVISTRKELNKIRKEMPYRLASGVDKIYGIQIKKFGNNFNKVIELNELEQIVLDSEAENILLKGVV
jgi:hypothetical protein